MELHVQYHIQCTRTLYFTRVLLGVVACALDQIYLFNHVMVIELWYMYVTNCY